MEYSLGKSEMIHQFESKYTISDMKLSPNFDLLAIGLQSGEHYMFEPKTGGMVKQFYGICASRIDVRWIGSGMLAAVHASSYAMVLYCFKTCFHFFFFFLHLFFLISVLAFLFSQIFTHA